MKKTTVLVAVTVMVLMAVMPAQAGGWRFAYKLSPGQEWTMTMASQNKSTVMGKENINRSRNRIRYRVKKHPKNGWVTLSANIFTGGNASPGMDLSRMTFTADMHASGEIRHIRVTGSPAPPMTGSEGMTPQMKAMMAQSYRYMADAWKSAVFWFPEFPEEKLDIGDEFEVTRKSGGNAGTMNMSVQTRQVYTLEDVSDGLAYFSVTERAMVNTKGLGGKTRTKSAGKGENIFDLREGMWVEMTVKRKSTVNMSGMPGMGEGSHDMTHITKYTMERR